MAGQCGLKLAVSLITAHFGDLVAKVCSCLLHRGTLTLQEIIRFTELSSSQVKNCLLVLIQHNCVQAFSTPRPAGPGGVAKAVTQYMALFDNILHRMRFAKFMAVVRDDLGPQCEILLAGLLQNGRLTFGQLVERASSNKPEGGYGFFSSPLLIFSSFWTSKFISSFRMRPTSGILTYQILGYYCFGVHIIFSQCKCAGRAASKLQ